MKKKDISVKEFEELLKDIRKKCNDVTFLCEEHCESHDKYVKAIPKIINKAIKALNLLYPEGHYLYNYYNIKDGNKIIKKENKYGSIIYNLPEDEFDFNIFYTHCNEHILDRLRVCCQQFFYILHKNKHSNIVFYLLESKNLKIENLCVKFDYYDMYRKSNSISLGELNKITLKTIKKVMKDENTRIESEFEYKKHLLANRDMLEYMYNKDKKLIKLINVFMLETNLNDNKKTIDIDKINKFTKKKKENILKYLKCFFLRIVSSLYNNTYYKEYINGNVEMSDIVDPKDESACFGFFEAKDISDFLNIDSYATKQLWEEVYPYGSDKDSKDICAIHLNMFLEKINILTYLIRIYLKIKYNKSSDIELILSNKNDMEYKLSVKQNNSFIIHKEKITDEFPFNYDESECYSEDEMFEKTLNKFLGK